MWKAVHSVEDKFKMHEEQCLRRQVTLTPQMELLDQFNHRNSRGKLPVLQMVHDCSLRK